MSINMLYIYIYISNNFVFMLAVKTTSCIGDTVYWLMMMMMSYINVNVSFNSLNQLPNVTVATQFYLSHLLLLTFQLTPSPSSCSRSHSSQTLVPLLHLPQRIHHRSRSPVTQRADFYILLRALRVQRDL